MTEVPSDTGEDKVNVGPPAELEAITAASVTFFILDLKLGFSASLEANRSDIRGDHIITTGLSQELVF